MFFMLQCSLNLLHVFLVSLFFGNCYNNKYLLIVTFQVLPSLDVAIYITPCTSKMQEFLVRMEIASRAMSENVWLRQLSSVGQRWEISSLPAHAICPSQLLLAGQALLCFFKLKVWKQTFPFPFYQRFIIYTQASL